MDLSARAPTKLDPRRSWGVSLLSGAGLLASLGVCACGSEQSCTLMLSFGAYVTVADASGNAVCDVTVEIAGGGDDLTKNLTMDDCSFSAGQRGGHYVISVTRGAALLATKEVNVASNDCGPITSKVTITVPDA